jgi:hypothetical protein
MHLLLLIFGAILGTELIYRRKKKKTKLDNATHSYLGLWGTFYLIHISDSGPIRWI